MRLVFLLAAAAAAQVVDFAPRQAMQPSPEEPVGTASIEGTVVNDVTNAPIRKAAVNLSGPLRGGPPPVAITDSAGHFAFTHLNPAAWTLQASHADYDMNRAMVLGDNYKQVTVTSDQHVTGVELRLTPMGSISGTLIDEYGDPAANCQVSAVSTTTASDVRRRGNHAASSDDRGEYRIADLPAGRYYVYQRCMGTLAAPHGFLPRGDPRTPALAFAPEFYGGTPGLTGAVSVVVRPGSEVRGIDFRLKTVAATPIQIRLASAEAFNPSLVQVIVRPVDANIWGFQAMFDPKTGVVRSEPAPPGSYTITAETSKDPRLFGQATITVSKGMPAIAEVQLAPPMTIAGTVRMHSDEKAEGGGIIQIMLQPAGQWFGGEMPQANVNKDGSFTLPNVTPGRWRLQVMNTPASVRSVSFGDREISPAAFDVAPGAAPPLNIVLTSKRVQIAVHIAGLENGRQAQVVGWSKDMEGADPYQQIGARVEGASSVANVAVAPGSYRFYAIETNAPWAIAQDEDLWRAISDRGKTVEAKDDAGSAAVSITLDLITRDDLRSALDREFQ